MGFSRTADQTALPPVGWQLADLWYEEKGGIDEGKNNPRGLYIRLGTI